MKQHHRGFWQRAAIRHGLISVGCLLWMGHGWAQALPIPGPADAARIEQRLPEIQEPALPKSNLPVRMAPSSPAPEGSQSVHFVLRGVQIKGATAFSNAQLRDIYADYLGREITLDLVWMMAGQITERYQQRGYFLSRAYVPGQTIEKGTVVIRVVEGFVDEVSLDQAAAENPLVQRWTQRIRDHRPLNLSHLESLLLRLNDLPGQDFRAVLEKPTDAEAPQGAVRLNLVSSKEKPQSRISMDNFGSRFLGPYEALAQTSVSLLPNHKTTLSVLSASQPEELKYGSLTHSITLGYDWMLDFSGSRTDTHPGYTLEPQEIDSYSTALGFGLTYQWVRQRQENLSTRFSMDMRNTTSDILKVLPLTRDRVRAARLSTNYQFAEASGAYNVGFIAVSQGLTLFGASEEGDANLSRAEAKPDFTKLEMLYTRLQPLAWGVNAVVSVSGQLASGPLYSSEEFGYGGQSFGRAYDASELTGDHGIDASVELRYNGVKPWEGITFSPYGFYDIGRVWNDDAGQEKQASGSSAGLGIRAASELGVTANLGVAFPLTREVETPLYGNSKGPRYMLQLSYDF